MSGTRAAEASFRRVRSYGRTNGFHRTQNKTSSTLPLPSFLIHICHAFVAESLPPVSSLPPILIPCPNKDKWCFLLFFRFYNRPRHPACHRFRVCIEETTPVLWRYLKTTRFALFVYHLQYSKVADIGIQWRQLYPSEKKDAARTMWRSKSPRVNHSISTPDQTKLGLCCTAAGSEIILRAEYANKCHCHCSHCLSVYLLWGEHSKASSTDAANADSFPFAENSSKDAIDTSDGGMSDVTE